MNAAYIVAIGDLVLALAIGYVGCAMASGNDRAERETAPWLLVSACVLLLAAIIFTGVGIDIQYT